MVDNKIYNCASYLRLSKEDIKNGDESTSIEGQRLINNSFAKHNNFNIVKEYVDDGFSGGNFNRPGFEKMINDIEKGIINCVITKDLTRLGREMYGTGRYIENYFLENNVRYIAINDSYDSLIGDSMLGIRLSVNDLYLRDVSKKVRTSFRAKMEKGDYIGSFPCYGYKKDPNNYHHLVIDEEAAKIVRMIYQMFLDGQSVRRICSRLTELKIPIPIVHKKDPRGEKVFENDGFGVWKHSTVNNILTSQMYIGNMVQHTYTKVSHTSKRLRKVEDNERIIVENTHEGIVTKEEFEKAQELIVNRNKTGRIPKNYDKLLLSGLMFCSNCGHALGIEQRTIKSGISRHTYCNYYARKGKHSNCTSNRLNYNDLESDILLYLRRTCTAFIKKYKCNDTVEDAVYYFNRDLDEFNTKKETLTKDINKEVSYISSLYNDLRNNVITNMVYKSLSDEHEKKLSCLQKELEIVNHNIELYSFQSKEQEFYNCRKSVEEFMTLTNPTKLLMRRLINKIVIEDNKEKNEKNVKVYLNYKFLADVVE